MNPFLYSSTNKSTPEILFEDPELLVCIKPAGIPTQTKSISTPDMVSLLKNHLRKTGTGKGEPYLAVIHRLDQPVEGLLVFAKTPAAAKSLNQQLQSSGFGKHYRAVLAHTPASSEGTLEHFLVKNARTNMSSVCTPDTPGARSARLSYRVLETDGDLCRIDITLDTGRHHQIRVQMAAIGCPLVGDRKYGSADPNAVPSPQLQLFAYRLTFRHPRTKKELEFILPNIEA